MTKQCYKKNINKHNLHWPQIHNHSHRILIVGRSGSGKTNSLLNPIKQQHDDYRIIDKFYLYVKDSYEVKYQYLTKTMQK